MSTMDWIFPQFDVAKSENGLTDVVKTIHWRLKCTDGDCSTETYGSISLGSPDKDNFISFDKLSMGWAVDAVVNHIDLAEISEQMQKEIDRQKNPPIVYVQPPFA